MFFFSWKNELWKLFSVFFQFSPNNLKRRVSLLQYLMYSISIKSECLMLSCERKHHKSGTFHWRICYYLTLHISRTRARSLSPRSSDISSESRDFSSICSCTSNTFIALVTDSGLDPGSSLLLVNLSVSWVSRLNCLDRGYSDPASNSLTLSSKLRMYANISSRRERKYHYLSFS